MDDKNQCPKCKGTGKLFRIGNGPNSVWMGSNCNDVFDESLRNRPMYTERYKCDLCDGYKQVSREQCFEWKIKNEGAK